MNIQYKEITARICSKYKTIVSLPDGAYEDLLIFNNFSDHTISITCNGQEEILVGANQRISTIGFDHYGSLDVRARITKGRRDDRADIAIEYIRKIRLTHKENRTESADKKDDQDYVLQQRIG